MACPAGVFIVSTMHRRCSRTSSRTVPVSGSAPSSGSDGSQLAAIKEAGKLKPMIDRVLPVEEVAAAHEYSKRGRAKAKIVLNSLAEGFGHDQDRCQYRPG
ncbi:MAG: zinc-binding dehydrogenase [Candidatus Dormibacteraeota bacterium]|uniref:Zinc-binding dehydrogenase n=2 Tax=Candidatus Dormiibacter inghamiae TaxID=3127013 RepID=A0A934KF50_9BACT|nr:zinc-binding dehydrogenase [Candidatus Dormibacteraeota bacterium]MBJ7607565.1 zinc-binding dehydrogenase [Candidatus Dormibacteraeota bacterium]